MADFREAMKASLRLLPAELRNDALRFWAVHQHLFPSPLPIAGALTIWLDEGRITARELVPLLQRMLRPERMGQYRFAADLMTALANEVAAEIKARELRQSREQRASDDEHNRRNALPPEELRKVVASFFNGFAEGVN